MLLDLIFGRSALAPSPSDDYWYNPVGLSSAAGVRVDERTALNYSAVWSATRLIIEPIAMISLLLYKTIGAGMKRPASEHRVFGLLSGDFNPEMTNMAFREITTARAVNWGNGYAEIERTVGGTALRLWPIHPSRIYISDVTRDPQTGEIIYHVRNDSGSKTPIRASNMIHVPGANSEDGIFGRGVIRHARESIGIGMAAERYGAGFYGNGARPGGVLEHPGKLSETATKNLRNSWNMLHQGPGAGHNLAILEEDMKYHVIDIPPEQAQFLQTREFGVIEIARWYNLPPHKLGDMHRSTHSNIEQSAIEYLASLIPWIIRWNQELEKKLLAPAERKEGYFCDHVVHELLAADSKARGEFIKNMFQVGAMSPNDALRYEYMDPIGPEGDLRFVPMNMMPLNRAEELAVAMVTSKAGKQTNNGVADNTVRGKKSKGGDPGRNGKSSSKNGKPVKGGSGGRKQSETESGTFGFKDAVEGLRASYDAMLAAREKEQAEWRERELGRLQTVIADAERGRQADFAEAAALAEESRAKQAAWDIERLDRALAEQASADKIAEIEAKIAEQEALSAAAVARETRQREAARDVLRHEVQRFATREANEARRAAKKPGEFLSWLDAFYGTPEEKYRDGTQTRYFRRDVGPAVAVWLAAQNSPDDPETTATGIVEQYATFSREALLAASDGDPGGFVDRVDETVTKWEAERAMEVVK